MPNPISKIFTSELSAAIQQLEQLTEELEREREQAAGAKPFEKIRRFGQWLFARRPLARIQGELPALLSKIQQALPVIAQMQEGTPEQQQLAHRAIQVIDSYNAAIDHVKGRLQAKVPLKEVRKISFAAVACSAKKYDKPQKRSTFLRRVDDAVRGRLPGILIPQDLDLFKMKAIMMLCQAGFTLPEAVEAANDTTQPLAVKEDAGFVTAIQTVESFPGEKMSLSVLFQLVGESNLLIHSQLFPLIRQTGFPSPWQHTGGWTLAPELLPCRGIGPSWDELHRKRQSLAQGLVAHEPLYGTAKELFLARKALFRQSSDELLALHKALAVALLGSEVLTHFAYFRNQPYPLLALAQSYKCFCDKYISGYDVRQHAPFVDLLGEALATPIDRVKEVASGKPLPLSSLERRLLLALYQQQMDFYKELNDGIISGEDLYQRLVKKLEGEIALFTEGEGAATPEACAALYEITRLPARGDAA